MPYQAPGVRVKVVNTPTIAGLKHGNIVNCNGVKGVAMKSNQIDRWVTPAAAQDIAAGEEYVIGVGGIVEVVVAGPVAALVKGDYVEVAANGLTLARVAAPGTVTVSTLGIVQSVDTTRTPNVARVNTNLP